MSLGTDLPPTTPEYEELTTTIERQRNIPLSQWESLQAYTANFLYKGTISEVVRAKMLSDALYSGQEINEEDWKRSSSFRPRLAWFPGMTNQYADMQASFHDLGNELEERAARGTKLAYIPGMFLGGLPDPINFVPMLSAVQKGKAAVLISRALPFGKSVGLGKSVGRIAGVAGAQAAETGLSVAAFQPAAFGLARVNQEDYDMTTAAANVMVGVGIGFGFGVVGKTLGTVLHPKAKDAAVRGAVADMAVGKDVDVGKTVKEGLVVRAAESQRRPTIEAEIQQNIPHRSADAIAVEDGKPVDLHITEERLAVPAGEEPLRFNLKRLGEKETWDAMQMEQPRKASEFASRDDMEFATDHALNLDLPIHESVVKELKLEGAMKTMNYEKVGEFYMPEENVPAVRSFLGVQQSPDFQTFLNNIADMPLSKLAEEFPAIAKAIAGYARSVDEMISVGATAGARAGQLIIAPPETAKMGGGTIVLGKYKTPYPESVQRLSHEFGLSYGQMRQILSDLAEMKESKRYVKEGLPIEAMKYFKRQAAREAIAGAGVTDFDAAHPTMETGSFIPPDKAAIIEAERAVLGKTFEDTQLLDTRLPDPEVGVSEQVKIKAQQGPEDIAAEIAALENDPAIANLNESEKTSLSDVKEQISLVNETAELRNSAIECLKGL